PFWRPDAAGCVPDPVPGGVTPRANLSTKEVVAALLHNAVAGGALDFHLVSAVVDRHRARGSDRLSQELATEVRHTLLLKLVRLRALKEDSQIVGAPAILF